MLDEIRLELLAKHNLAGRIAHGICSWFYALPGLPQSDFSKAEVLVTAGKFKAELVHAGNVHNVFLWGIVAPDNFIGKDAAVAPDGEDYVGIVTGRVWLSAAKGRVRVWGLASRPHHKAELLIGPANLEDGIAGNMVRYEAAFSWPEGKTAFVWIHRQGHKTVPFGGDCFKLFGVFRLERICKIHLGAGLKD